MDVSANKQLSSPSARLPPPPTATPSRDKVAGWVPVQSPHRSEGIAHRAYGSQDVERGLPREITIGPRQPIPHQILMTIAKGHMSLSSELSARSHTTQSWPCWSAKRSEQTPESTVTRSANLQQHPYFSIGGRAAAHVQCKNKQSQQHIAPFNQTLVSRSRGFSQCSQRSSHETLDWLKHPHPVPEYPFSSTHPVTGHSVTDEYPWRHDSHRDLYSIDGYGYRDGRQENDNSALLRNTSHPLRPPCLKTVSCERLPLPPLPPRSPFRLDHIDSHAVRYLNDSRSPAGFPRPPVSYSTWPKHATAATDSSWDYRTNGTRFREHFEDDHDEEERAPRAMESYSGGTHYATCATLPSRPDNAYDPRTRGKKKRTSLRNVFARDHAVQAHKPGRTVQEIAAAPFDPLPTHKAEICTPNAESRIQHSDHETRQENTTWSQCLVLFVFFITCTILAACKLASYPNGILFIAPVSLCLGNATSREAAHAVIADLAQIKTLEPGIRTPTFGAVVLVVIVSIAVYKVLSKAIEWSVRCVERRWVRFESGSAMGFWIQWVRGFLRCVGAWRETLGVLGGACGAAVVVAGVVWGVLA